jgi:hypothetical protein
MELVPLENVTGRRCFMFAVILKDMYYPMTDETPNNSELHQPLLGTRRVRYNIFF